MAPTDAAAATTATQSTNPPPSTNQQQNKFPYLKPHQFPGAYVRPLKKHKNMEVRARAGKHHGQLPFAKDLGTALYGYGNATHPDIRDAREHRNRDSLAYLARPVGAVSHSGAYNVPVHPPNTRAPAPFHKPFESGKKEEGEGQPATYAVPFPETVRVLDEIVTDFIIEVCHEAVDHATYEGRHKVNPQDLHWVFRKDQEMLGRLKERATALKMVQEDKKGLNANAGVDGGLAEVKKMTVEEMQELGDVVGEEGTGKGKGRGRGRRKKRVKDQDQDGDEVDDGADGGSLVGGAASDGGEKDGLSVNGNARPHKRARSEAT